MKKETKRLLWHILNICILISLAIFLGVRLNTLSPLIIIPLCMIGILSCIMGMNYILKFNNEKSLK